MNLVEKFFSKYFKQTATDQPTESNPHEADLASAALLFEVIRSDQEIKSVELTLLRERLMQVCDLNSEEVDDIINLASDEVDAAVSLYQFTSKITQHFDPEQRVRLIENMWRMAYADSILDKHEEYIIRRVASLIHVSQANFIKARQKVRAEDNP